MGTLERIEMKLALWLVVFVTWSGVAAAADNDVPFPPFFLAKETTYFSGPLRRDGTVDYVAAMNEQLGRGVTKENSAAVPFLEAVMSGPEGNQQRAHYARVLVKLGVA